MPWHAIPGFRRRKPGYATGCMDSRPAVPDNRAMEDEKNQGLLAAPPRVVNVGLEMFAANLAQRGATVVHVQWTPPAGGDAQLARLLDRLRS